ncbi:hypothetical protein CCZ01_02070 [Helicobacter monodelphidis]|uniref:glycosyltransferase family 4 protein n=1 Tax=Helicobacter sp. 15-1451 TaxID=2004995 RepID=UPI000DCD73D5|nr:glycosyltransferase family 1 protein [Helicobacter sp. 15-1451]RAX58594.1 hypothetical protein CCZ01_02070 [Helicobacter sp. 15-1451]
MKLLVNLGIITSPLTGIGYYLYRSIQELLKKDEITELAGFTQKGWKQNKQEVSDYLQNVYAQSNAQVENVYRFVALRKALVKSHFIRLAYYATRDLLLKKELQSKEDFLYWDGGYIPVAFKGKRVITIHDISHIRYGEFHPKTRVQLLNYYLPRAIQKSQHLFSVSHFSKQEIMEYFGVKAEKISVLYPPIAPIFKPYRQEEIQPLLQLHSLRYKGYILSVATLEPRKNFQRLLEAYMRLEKSTREEFPLVLVGGVGWLSEPLMYDISVLQKEGSVRMLGYVAGEDLPLFYAGAKAFAYVSLYEGYGMPIAESLKCGVPVVTSRCGAMLESGGKSSIYVDPLNIDEIADGLNYALKLGEYSLDTSHIWDNQRSAEEIFNVLNAI